MKDLKPKTCKFVEITEIVPKGWDGWFYHAISEGAPFSWGDNNRTMVDALSFRNHVSEVLSIHEDFDETEKEYESNKEAFYDILNYLDAKKIYIDLEN